jgi:hypothetical protein
LFLVYVVPDSNLAHHDPKMALVNLLAIVIALVAVAGIWYVRAALEARFAGKMRDKETVSTVQDSIQTILDLRTFMQRFITLLGAMIALSTLTKGALRQAFLATGGNPVEFPAEYVLLQGAYFTGLLALVYTPTFAMLTGVGANLVENVYPVKEPEFDFGNLSQWQANRKSLEELLQLRSSAADNLQAGISILAPVATSVISVMLGTK